MIKLFSVKVPFAYVGTNGSELCETFGAEAHDMC